MEITQLDANGAVIPEIPRPTDDEMRNEYRYILAQQISKKMLDSGLIFLDEFNKITAKNRKTFSPLIAKITG